MLRIDAAFATDDRFRHVSVERFFTSPLAGSQHVEADTACDGRQPSAQILDRADVRAAETKPRLLDSVLRFGEGAQHPISDGPEVPAIRLESLGQPSLIFHRISTACRS